jgi:hypothetical protein
VDPGGTPTISFDAWRQTVIGTAGIVTTVVGTGFGIGFSLDLTVPATLIAAVLAAVIVARRASLPLTRVILRSISHGHNIERPIINPRLVRTGRVSAS